MRNLLALALLACVTALAQTDAHHDAANQRGDKAMGFMHNKTTHHFVLKNYGGDIDVSANHPEDIDSRDHIRHHLAMIQKKFSSGDFSHPMFIHDRVPPGVPEMKSGKVSYQFEETPQGARLKVSAQDEKTIAAIHDFLVFQIEDHQTGDQKIVQR